MKSFVFFLICSVSATAKSLEGKLQATDTGGFLNCNGSKCWFDNTGLKFKRETGHDGQYKFVVQGGSYNGKCLDREHCHSGSSNARISDCNHCGSYHWQLKGGKLAEDHMLNCIQNDGYVRHCRDQHQSIHFVEEKGPFHPPKGFWKLAGTATNGEIALTINWGTESSDSAARTEDWARSLSYSFEEGLIFESEKIETTFSHSIAKTMTQTFTQTVSQSCEATCPKNKHKPFVFLYQWYTESTHSGASAADITRATSCFTQCIYGHNGSPIVPKCPWTCCADAACQKCNPRCKKSLTTSNVTVI